MHHGRYGVVVNKGKQKTHLPNQPALDEAIAAEGRQAPRRSGATGKRTGAVCIEGRHARHAYVSFFRPKSWVFKIKSKSQDILAHHPKCTKENVFVVWCSGDSALVVGVNPLSSTAIEACSTSLHDSKRQYLQTSGGGRKHRISQDLSR